MPTASSDRARRATTRWCPAGTAWPSPRSRRRGPLLDRPELVEAASAAARFLLGTHVRRAPDATVRLVRASRDGLAGDAPAVLEDYAHVADGLLTLGSVTGDPEWFRAAGDLLETVLVHFAAADGGLRDTADDETDAVLSRIRTLQDPADGPTPSGQSAAAGALLTYSALTGSLRHREAAERALAGPLRLAGRFPRAAGAALAVVEALLDGPREVAVVGPARRPGDADAARGRAPVDRPRAGRRGGGAGCAGPAPAAGPAARRRSRRCVRVPRVRLRAPDDEPGRAGRTARAVSAARPPSETA